MTTGILQLLFIFFISIRCHRDHNVVVLVSALFTKVVPALLLERCELQPAESTDELAELFILQVIGLHVKCVQTVTVPARRYGAQIILAGRKLLFS